MDSVSITSAYMWAFVTLVVLFLVAVLISNSIMFKPNDPGTTKRRICFWVLCVLSGVVSFLINYLIGQGIEVPSLQSSYMMHSGIASAIAVVLYIIIGFVVSKMFSNSKVGTWF